MLFALLLLACTPAPPGSAPPAATSLTKAASSFTQAPARVSASGQVRAHLVENRWDASKDGQDYLVLIEDADEPKLPVLRAEFVEKLEAAADQYGWSKPTAP